METFPFSWIPEEEWQSEGARVVVVEIDPEHVKPVLSVQHTLNRCHGIIRGLKDSHGNLIVDHVDEVLGEDGHLCRLPEGQRLTGADDMRRDLWTIDEHVQNAANLSKTRTVIAVGGAGDILANPGRIALVSQGGAFYRLAGEDALLPRTYSCVACWADRVLSLERFRIVPAATAHADTFGDPPVEVQTDSGRPVSPRGHTNLAWALSGPWLVRDGLALTENELAEQVQQGFFYDLRHVFLFGRIDLTSKGPQRTWLDAGLGLFWDGQGNLARDALEQALGGRPGELDISQFEREDAEAALKKKGYQPSSGEPTKTGEFTIMDVPGGSRKLLIRFLPGIYPLHILAEREDGKILDVYITGRSNRVGMTLRNAADTLVALGARWAVLIDEGADVMLRVRDEWHVVPEGNRNKLRGALVWRLRAGRDVPPPGAFRTILSPWQLPA